MTKNFDMHEWRLKQFLKEADFNPKKADLNHDGKLSSYEKKRGMAVAKNMNEDDWMQPDDESDMAHSQLYNIKELATKLCAMIKDNDQLDAWVQAKLTKAEDYLDTVYHYLEGEEYTDHSNHSPEIILGGLNEVNPSDLKIGKSYSYKGTTPSGKNHKILIFKGIKKYNQGKEHYYFTDNKGTSALLSHDDIINNITNTH